MYTSLKSSGVDRVLTFITPSSVLSLLVNSIFLVLITCSRTHVLIYTLPFPGVFNSRSRHVLLGFLRQFI